MFSIEDEDPMRPGFREPSTNLLAAIPESERRLMRIEPPDVDPYEWEYAPGDNVRTEDDLERAIDSSIDTFVHSDESIRLRDVLARARPARDRGLFHPSDSESEEEAPDVPQNCYAQPWDGPSDASDNDEVEEVVEEVVEEAVVNEENEVVEDVIAGGGEMDVVVTDDD